MEKENGKISNRKRKGNAVLARRVINGRPAQFCILDGDDSRLEFYISGGILNRRER